MGMKARGHKRRVMLENLPPGEPGTDRPKGAPTLNALAGGDAAIGGQASPSPLPARSNATPSAGESPGTEPLAENPKNALTVQGTGVGAAARTSQPSQPVLSTADFIVGEKDPVYHAVIKKILFKSNDLVVFHDESDTVRWWTTRRIPDARCPAIADFRVGELDPVFKTKIQRVDVVTEDLVVFCDDKNDSHWWTLRFLPKGSVSVADFEHGKEAPVFKVKIKDIIFVDEQVIVFLDEELHTYWWLNALPLPGCQ